MEGICECREKIQSMGRGVYALSSRFGLHAVLTANDGGITSGTVTVELTGSLASAKIIETVQTIGFGRPEFMLRVVQAVAKNLGTEPIQPVSVRNRVIPV
jgi:hypothetical protein